MSEERLSKAIARIRAFSAHLKEERERASSMLRILQKFPENPKEYVKNESKIRKLLDRCFLITDEQVQETAAELSAALEAFLAESRKSFLQEFRDEAKRQGVDAQLRDSVFFAGGLRLSPDLSKGRCELRFAEEVVERELPLDARRCLDALTKHSNRLLKAREPADVILSALHAAYLGASGQRELGPGEYAPIIAVLGQMVIQRQSPAFRRDPTRRRFSDYSRVDFSADLCALRSARQLDIRGQRLHLQTAVIDTAGKRARSISVPSEDGRSMIYYQALAFQANRGGRS